MPTGRCNSRTQRCAAGNMCAQGFTRGSSADVTGIVWDHSSGLRDPRDFLSPVSCETVMLKRPSRSESSDEDGEIAEVDVASCEKPPIRRKLDSGEAAPVTSRLDAEVSVAGVVSSEALSSEAAAAQAVSLDTTSRVAGAQGPPRDAKHTIQMSDEEIDGSFTARLCIETRDSLVLDTGGDTASCPRLYTLQNVFARGGQASILNGVDIGKRSCVRARQCGVDGEPNLVPVACTRRATATCGCEEVSGHEGGKNCVAVYHAALGRDANTRHGGCV